MKRILAIVFCIIVIFGIVACNNNNSESSVNLDSSLPNEEVPEATAPPVDENPYPNNVVAIEGVNRYEHLKMEAPAKTVSVTEYQDYGIEQIDIYLNAIAQDESITYNTDYLCLELTKRKYAIYTQENFDKIDLILIDAENLLKKYILDDETLSEIEAKLGKDAIKYYYGKHEDMYFIVFQMAFFNSTWDNLYVGNMYFIYTYDTEMYLYVWNSEWKDIKKIKEAYGNGLVSIDILSELFPQEVVRLCKNEIYPFYNPVIWESDYVTASNFDTLQEENSPFVINMHAQESMKCEVKENLPNWSAEITFVVGVSYLDNLRVWPYGVIGVECGIVNNNGSVLTSKYIYEEKSERNLDIFLGPTLIHYYRDGSIKNIEYYYPEYFIVKEKLLLEDNSEWVRFYINLEYTNGYKETYYGEKLYYSVNKNQYDAQNDKYYNVYTFSEKGAS